MIQNNTSQAEVKTRKFRETLTSNVDGNPEPSPENREGAETRHGLCVKCGGPIPSDKYKNAIYCSLKCRQRELDRRHRIKIGKKVDVGSGGNQWGKNNHQYKTGIGRFREVGFTFHGYICNRCKNTNNLLVHHIDQDRTNNTPENLEVLCKRCHQNHHCLRDELGRFMSHT